MLYFVRTTNTCRPTNRTILRCELDILGSNTAWQGVGRLLRNSYSKFRHISLGQMVTEHPRSLCSICSICSICGIGKVLEPCLIHNITI